MKSILTFLATFVFVIFTLYGCKSETPLPPSKISNTRSVKEFEGKPKVPQHEMAIQEASSQEGYIYKQRDRRDPFAPLIVPIQKRQKKDSSKVGTLEGYDIGEFHLVAIAKKDMQYFALLVTPDNRSFTVSKGAIIGLNKGRVEEISRDKIVLVEYTRDYRGELKPRQIILEFYKGE